MPAKAVPKALGPQAPTQGDNAPPTATPATMPKARCPKALTPGGTAPQGGIAPEAQQGGAHKFPLVNWDPGSIPDPSLPANELAEQAMTGEETAKLMYGIVKVVRADLPDCCRFFFATRQRRIRGTQVSERLSMSMPMSKRT